MSDTYIYNADLYCQDCAEEIMESGLDGAEKMERYDDFINDVTGYMYIMGVQLAVDAAEILKEYDRTAYNCGFNDWLDSELRDGNFLDAESKNSDEFPQKCPQYGGGEADIPSHCAECGEFLENPLTTDGEKYVKENWGSWGEDVRSFYSYLAPEGDND